jgi:hypothetical protein
VYTKVELYNLALSALLLQRQLVDTTTDNSNEKVTLDQFYNIALYSTLEDLDLDSTSTKVALALTTSTPSEPYNQLWNYVYQYPSNCLYFRGIFSGYYKDTRRTHIPKAVEIYAGSKSILTNEASAVGVYIPKDLALTSLNPMAGMAIAYRLASLAAPLIVGKGAQKLRLELQKQYEYFKAASQEHDKNENFNFHEEFVESEFVEARMT